MLTTLKIFWAEVFRKPEKNLICLEIAEFPLRLSMNLWLSCAQLVTSWCSVTSVADPRPWHLQLCHYGDRSSDRTFGECADDPKCFWWYVFIQTYWEYNKMIVVCICIWSLICLFRCMISSFYLLFVYFSFYLFLSIFLFLYLSMFYVA